MSRKNLFIICVLAGVVFLISSCCNKDRLKPSELLKKYPGVDSFPSLLQKSTLSSAYRDPVDRRIAMSGASLYRSEHSKDYNGGAHYITYDTAVIIKYIREKFKSLTDSHPVPNNHIWQAGFYPVSKIKGNYIYVDFVVIPTLMDTISGKTHDYFNDTAKVYKSSVVAYDFGNLHP